MHAKPPCGCANDRRDAGPDARAGRRRQWKEETRSDAYTEKTGTRVALYFLSRAATGSFLTLV